MLRITEYTPLRLPPAWRRGLALLLVAVLATCATSCVTSPTGRSQLILVSDDTINAMGAQSFAQMQEELPLSTDGRQTQRLTCITNAIVAVLNEPHMPRRWEVRLFADDAVNAFALPGGYIGVYQGMLQVAQDQHQLAAVIGHEIAHVTARHAAERVSRYQTAGFALQVLTGLGGTERTAALLGLGAQYGVLLPFDRAQESESDRLGLLYMADAGFNPQAAVQLWQNMAALQGASMPDFLSTHPSGGTRIADLNRRMPAAMERYQRAQAMGRRPNCDS